MLNKKRHDIKTQTHKSGTTVKRSPLIKHSIKSSCLLLCKSRTRLHNSTDSLGMNMASLGTCCGVWHQEVGSRIFGAFEMRGGASIGLIWFLPRRFGRCLGLFFCVPWAVSEQPLCKGQVHRHDIWAVVTGEYRVTVGEIILRVCVTGDAHLQTNEPFE